MANIVKDGLLPICSLSEGLSQVMARIYESTISLFDHPITACHSDLCILQWLCWLNRNETVWSSYKVTSLSHHRLQASPSNKAMDENILCFMKHIEKMCWCSTQVKTDHWPVWWPASLGWCLDPSTMSFILDANLLLWHRVTQTFSSDRREFCIYMSIKSCCLHHLHCLAKEMCACSCLCIDSDHLYSVWWEHSIGLFSLLSYFMSSYLSEDDITTEPSF